MGNLCGGAPNVPSRNADASIQVPKAETTDQDADMGKKSIKEPKLQTEQKPSETKVDENELKVNQEEIKRALELKIQEEIRTKSANIFAQ